MEKRGTVLTDRYFWLAMVAAGFFLSLTLWFGFTMDQAIFNYVAWVWKEFQGPPYVAAWDHSFPGIFIIHRLVLEIFGPSFFGFRFFDFLVQLSSAGMIFYLSRKFSGSSPGGFFSALAYSIYYFGLGGLETGEREGFILWLLLSSLVLSIGLQGRVLLRSALVGLLLGFAFQLKPTFGLSWPVFGVWFWAQGIHKRPRAVLGELFIFSLACVLPSLLFALFYWRIGHFNDLYQAIIWFNFHIYGSTTEAIRGLSRGMLTVAIANSFFLKEPAVLIFGGMGILLAWANRDRPEPQPFFRVLLALIAVGLSSFIIQAKFFPYHLIPFFGLMMIFAGSGIYWLARELKDQASGLKSRLDPAFFYLAVVLLLIAGINPKLLDSAAAYSFRSLDQAYSSGSSYDAYYYRAAKYMRSFISEQDRIEYFGWQPLLPYLLRKKLPSRFCCVHHLLMRQKNGRISELQEKWIQEYTSEVISARPRFFLVSDLVPGWEVFNLEYPSLKRALKEKFPELQNFLNQNYKLKTKLGEIEVYELNVSN